MPETRRKSAGIPGFPRNPTSPANYKARIASELCERFTQLNKVQRTSVSSACGLMLLDYW